jgi:Tfp pilus assembly protein PilV
MSLIEVMVATALLAVVVTASVAALYQVSSASNSVRTRTIAAALAWSRVERARHMSFEDIDLLVEEGSGTILDEDGIPSIDGLYKRQTSVELLENGLPMKRISVDVWPMDRQSNTFKGDPECVETVIADIPIRGIDE